MKSYYDKRDEAIKQDTKVRKIKDEAPKGAKSYIALRKSDLKKVRGY